tara:strand:- start:107 stop:424 length:318 start_codon:yes stop_codon:yes gene_type:complete
MTIQNKNSPTDKTNRYVFAQKGNADYSSIKLTEGKFKDVIYHYGKVSFAPEENADGKLPMKFDYTVDKNPNDIDLLDNQEFIDYIGDILIELLDEKVKDGTAIQD